jgi:hypothetical protein
MIITTGKIHTTFYSTKTFINIPFQIRMIEENIHIYNLRSNFYNDMNQLETNIITNLKILLNAKMYNLIHTCLNKIDFWSFNIVNNNDDLTYPFNIYFDIKNYI